MTAALEATGIVRRFGGVVAVDGVDLAVPRGRVTALVGPNGAGKSTLFDCLAGAGRPDAGNVRLAGRDITRLPAHRRVRAGLARTFQVLSVFPSLTVEDNVRIGAENRLGTGTARRLLGLPDPARAGARATVDQVLGTLGLDGVRGLAAAGLPTGTLRLVELGRALATSPSVLLLDEPAGGLDDAGAGRLREVLRRLADDGLAILLVEHDMDLVFRVADTVHVMAAGAVVASGPPEAVRMDAAARAAYLDPPAGDGGS